MAFPINGIPFLGLRRLSLDPSWESNILWQASGMLSNRIDDSNKFIGHIAKLIGMPRHSRHVGQALKFLGDATVPWQRVIGASGAISSRGPGTDGAQQQAQALQAEGVDVQLTRGGQYTVSFAEYGWFPENIELDEE